MLRLLKSPTNLLKIQLKTLRTCVAYFCAVPEPLIDPEIHYTGVSIKTI